MKVKELIEYLETLIADGKGNYTVNLLIYDGLSDNDTEAHLDSLDIQDDYEEIVLKGM